MDLEQLFDFIENNVGLAIAVAILTIFLIGYNALTAIFGTTVSDLTKYNNKATVARYIAPGTAPVTGCDVISQIKNNSSSTFIVTVQTKQGNSIDYNSPDGYKITDQSDINYINPFSKFTQKLIENSNGTITGITYVEV